MVHKVKLNNFKEHLKEMWILTLNSYTSNIKESFEIINRQNKIM